MRLYACAAALSLLCQLSFALNDPLIPRQDSDRPRPLPSTAIDVPPPSRNQTDTPPPSTRSRPSSTNLPAPTTTPPLTTSAVASEPSVLPISTSTTPAPPTNTTSPNNGTMYDPSEDLPLVVEITPAYGLAGIVLLLSGAVYALAGVRVKALQLSFSMAYLVATAITVLIIYVARPPISNAVQGAYFVGVFLPAAILGGLALIFPEITEGLGCLLGGFCLSMWLLCLKPGGLISSTDGRIAIIAAFSVAAFALSFSKYTKTYGLIVSISFAGATATILGIDCFTRAGLKEFWVWIWNLNDQLFPLDTNTYPVTRGMKAELAGVIIIFICGVISQMKLWKIIKERREKKNTAREQDEEDREHLEADLGRQINETNTRERAEWEAMYNKERGGEVSSIHDSTYDSTFESTHSGFGGTDGKGPATSIKEVYGQSTENIELSEMNTRRRESRVGGVFGDEELDNQKRVTVRVAQDHEDNGSATWRTQWESYSIPDSHLYWHPSRASSTRTVKTSQPTPPAQSREPTDTPQPTSQTQFKEQPRLAGAIPPVPTLPVVPPAPQVIPLPFKVPEELQDEHSDAESQATAGQSERGNQPQRKRPDRFSIMPNARYSVSGYDDDETATMDQVLSMKPRSRASSVAATLDELTDDDDEGSGDGNSRSSSPGPGGHDDKIVNGITITKRPKSAASEHAEDQAPLADAEDIAKDDEAVHDPNQDIGRARSGTTDDKAPRDLGQILGLTTSRPGERPSTAKTVKSAKSTKRAKRVSIESDASKGTLASNKPLPEKLSNVAMAYRTNEWAKHLEVADKPDLEELSSPPSPGIAIERMDHEEAAPVRVEDLQQSATTAMINNAAQNSAPNSTVSQGVGRSASQMQIKRSSSNPYINSIPAQPSIVRSTTNPTGNRNSILGLKRSTSQPGAFSGLRSGSTPILSQPLHESPIEDMSDVPLPNQPHMGMSSTLLSQRENLMRNKITSTSFNNLALTPAAPSINGISPSDSASIRNVPFEQEDDNVSLSSLKQQLMDEENMPLSQRRHIMQQRQADIQQQQMQMQLQMQMQNQMSQPQVFNAHQPRRGSSLDPATREARFANWREIMRRETGPTETQLRTQEGDRNRAILLQNQRQAQMNVQQQKWATNMRETAIDERMRNGQMIDLHRMHMRKMQSESQPEQQSQS